MIERLSSVPGSFGNYPHGWRTMPTFVEVRLSEMSCSLNS